MTYCVVKSYDPPTPTACGWATRHDTHSTAHAGATVCIFFIGKLSWGLTNNARLAASKPNTNN